MHLKLKHGFLKVSFVLRKLIAIDCLPQPASFFATDRDGDSCDSSSQNCDHRIAITTQGRLVRFGWNGLQWLPCGQRQHCLQQGNVG